MTSVTPGREELKRHEGEFYLLMRSLLTDVAIGKLGIMSSRANDLLHKLKHLESLRLAAKPADEGILAALVDARPYIASTFKRSLHAYDKAALEQVDDAIRALSTTGEPKP